MLDEVTGGSARSQQKDMASSTFSPSEIEVKTRPLPRRSKQITGFFQETSCFLFLENPYTRSHINTRP